GTDAGNYTFNTTANATADITAKTLTITASGINKVYDGNSAATVTLNDDRISGDILAAAYAGASFDSKNAGIGKAISVNGISIAGSDASNYIFNTAASTTGNITSRAVTVTAQAQSKVYGEADPALTYTVSPPLVTGDTFTGALGRAAGENVGSYAIDLNTLALSPNYDLVFAPAALTITKAPLTITAGNKQKFVGTANPELTVTYSGFVNGEQSSVLSQQPSVTTTATTASPLGDYPITATGAAAANYEITYVNGTLKVVPGAPTSVALASVTLHENRPAGTAAGTLSSTSEDPNAVFTYELVTGSGDTDNSLFTIAGNKLQTAALLNFEQKNSYSVRVRSTTQHGFSLDQVFTVALSDVNETPTLAAIADETICHTTAPMTVQMSGATAGPETSQAISYAVSSDNDDLFDELSINASGQLTYQVKNGRSGTANVTVTVTDNGGTANGGVDTFSRTFVITVNPLPVITIASDKGNSISKGDVMRLTATGGATYSWTNPGGIVSGLQSATVTFRPEKTATYRVTVTTAAGCVENHEITIEVKEDYVMLNQTNIVTPNGDGVNDNFVIKNIDMYPNNVVKIYDRAGRLLYSKNNYTNEWNGTVEGSPLAEGTYYYIVDFGTNRPVLKGFITIVKD
ncbi:MAG TPA: MBG domain-containing protein, partial [Sphingobacteriaceae bacterium]